MKKLLCVAALWASGCGAQVKVMRPPTMPAEAVLVEALELDNFDVRHARHDRTSATSETIQVRVAVRQAGLDAVERLAENQDVPFYMLRGRVMRAPIDEWVGSNPRSLRPTGTHFVYVEQVVDLSLRDPAGHEVMRAHGSTAEPGGLPGLLQELSQKMLSKLPRKESAAVRSSLPLARR